METGTQQTRRSLCIGLLAHVDAGKTSITEQLLYRSGAIRSPGRVDSGTAQTDQLGVERRRGISVRAAEAGFCRDDTRIHLIDTPGHVDFSGEVERCLAALDGVVLVISAMEGVQPQTRLIWQALERMGIPTLIFLNKIDRAGASVERTLDEVRALLSPRLLVAAEGINVGTDEAAVRPLIPHELDTLWEDALSAAAEYSPEAEEAFFAGEPVERETLTGWLREGVAARQLFPVLLGSAKTGAGMEELLDGLCWWLPAGEAGPEAPLSGVVYRVTHDTMGRGAHLRLFGGTLQNRDTLTRPDGTPAGKVSQIRRFQGAKAADLGSLSAGEIGVVYGTDLKVGEVVGQDPGRPACQLAVPVLTVQAFPPDPAELPALAAALSQLTDEDPLLQLCWVREKGELHLNITGVIQLEVLTELLAERYGLEVRFSRPSVLYRETPASAATGRAVYLSPKPCWAIVELAVEPLPPGSGIRFQSAIKGGTLPYQYQNHVAQSLPGALEQGLMGWPVTDAAFTLTDGQSHHVHTHPLDFFVATPMAVMDALEKTGTTLLEPMLRVTLSASEDLLGRVVGDMLAMRGSFDTPVIRDGSFTMEAILPVSTSLDYPVQFRSMTRGEGSWFSAFDGYQPCPPELGATLPRRTPDPRDREKWILYRRGAIRDGGGGIT